MMRLLIVSHVIHYKSADGYIHAYAPYAKEIEIWADLFSEIVIAAPCREQAPSLDACRIARSNIRMAPQWEVGGTTYGQKILAILAVPGLVAGLSRQMLKADAIHVRCPGNLSLLGAMLAPLFSRRIIAKYAGSWSGSAHEELTVALQRRILRSGWWRGPVTVYGKKPQEPAHVVDFFSSMFTAEQLTRARISAAKKQMNTPATVMFLGRLTRAKNVDVLLKAIAQRKTNGQTLYGLIVGGGPERASLENLAADLGISDQIEFAGAVPPETVPNLLERADVLVLASDSEGWPKAIAEAMAFGLVCIGSDMGMIPRFLADGRGLTVPPRDVDALARALDKVCTPGEWETMSVRGARWAQRYSLESLREALRTLMSERWQLSDLNVPRRGHAEVIR